jgi:hypothetical protein
MALVIRVMSNDREQGLKEMVESNPFTCLHIKHSSPTTTWNEHGNHSTRLQEKKGLHPTAFSHKSTRLTRRSSTRLAQSSPATTIRESGQWVRGLKGLSSAKTRVKRLADTDPPPWYGTSDKNMTPYRNRSPTSGNDSRHVVPYVCHGSVAEPYTVVIILVGPSQAVHKLANNLPTKKNSALAYLSSGVVSSRRHNEYPAYEDIFRRATDVRLLMCLGQVENPAYTCI